MFFFAADNPAGTGSSATELVTEPVRVDRRALARAVRDQDAGSVRMPVTMATRKAGGGSMYTEPLRE
jgi:hypothetical protein